MTDGPFRNLRLTTAWKRYGDDLVNDAKSKDERVARASHAVLADANVDEISSLIKALQGYADRLQLDLTPQDSIERILQEHSRVGLSNDLARNLMANMSEYETLSAALNASLQGVTADLIASSKNRLDEHCMQSRDFGDMNAADYRKAFERNAETFAALDADRIAIALRTGDRRAFSADLKKKEGVDDAPDF
ncbi:hypothetical protein [Novosphingobium profundi]|uniref:hypothetical protein n=1 Tax=Novosphingobium profundi TaxID=1774954 RepID=UPI001CFEB298|nr:hypothetical protein [Novosphingobium profundi]